MFGTPYFHEPYYVSSWTEQDGQVADDIMTMWTNFAEDGETGFGWFLLLLVFFVCFVFCSIRQIRVQGRVLRLVSFGDGYRFSTNIAKYG